MRAALTALAALFAAWFCAAPNATALCLFSCSCTASADPLGFGAIDVLHDQPVDAVGAVRVSCTGVLNLAVTNDIALSKGGAATFSRRMASAGGDLLPYNLYRDAGRTSIWGDGSGGTQIVSKSFTLGLFGFSYTQPIYARAPPAPMARPGFYSDAILVTITY